jgi:hypothetical protein
MNVRISVRLAGIFVILFSSACTSLDNGLQQSREKRTVGQRVERFAKSMTHTLTNAASDVLPIFSATTNEIVHELKSDLPKVTEELSTQLSRTASFLRSPSETAP